MLRLLRWLPPSCMRRCCTHTPRTNCTTHSITDSIWVVAGSSDGISVVWCWIWDGGRQHMAEECRGSCNCKHVVPVRWRKGVRISLTLSLQWPWTRRGVSFLGDSRRGLALHLLLVLVPASLAELPGYLTFKSLCSLCLAFAANPLFEGHSDLVPQGDRVTQQSEVGSLAWQPQPSHWAKHGDLQIVL